MSHSAEWQPLLHPPCPPSQFGSGELDRRSVVPAPLIRLVPRDTDGSIIAAECVEGVRHFASTSRLTAGPKNRDVDVSFLILHVDLWNADGTISRNFQTTPLASAEPTTPKMNRDLSKHNTSHYRPVTLPGSDIVRILKYSKLARSLTILTATGNATTERGRDAALTSPQLATAVSSAGKIITPHTWLNFHCARIIF